MVVVLARNQTLREVLQICGGNFKDITTCSHKNMVFLTQEVHSDPIFLILVYAEVPLLDLSGSRTVVTYDSSTLTKT